MTAMPSAASTSAPVPVLRLTAAPGAGPHQPMDGLDRTAPDAAAPSPSAAEIDTRSVADRALHEDMARGFQRALATGGVDDRGAFLLAPATKHNPSEKSFAPLAIAGIAVALGLQGLMVLRFRAGATIGRGLL